MVIWLTVHVMLVALLALGVWSMQRLYGTPGRCEVQSSTHVRQSLAAPQIQPHGVIVWHDDGAACVDGEVLP